MHSAKQEHIAFAVSRAIRHGRWLDISYRNKKKEDTRFLFAVKDVDLGRQKNLGFLLRLFMLIKFVKILIMFQKAILGTDCFSCEE